MDELVTDALVALAVLEGQELDAETLLAAELLATVAGQDVEWDEAGKRFRIRNGVAEGRVISTVDPDARHGRKSNRGPFDGFKAHVAVEPESEIITEAGVAPANVSDGAMAPQLLPELHDTDAEITTFGDTHYGTGDTGQALIDAGATVIAKAPPGGNSNGGFAKSQFKIDLEAGTATCPAGVTVGSKKQAEGRARFQFPAAVCASCPLRAQCTDSKKGRIISIGPHEAILAEARVFQQTEAFKQPYNATRPIVERIIYRLIRRGGRQARYRGTLRVCEQVERRAAAENLRRMVRVGLRWSASGGWTVA